MLTILVLNCQLLPWIRQAGGLVVNKTDAQWTDDAKSGRCWYKTVDLWHGFAISGTKTYQLLVWLWQAEGLVVNEVDTQWTDDAKSGR